MPVTNAEESVIFNNVKNLGEKAAYEMGLSFQGSRQIQEVALQNFVNASQVATQIMQSQVQSAFTVNTSLMTVLTQFIAAHSKSVVEPDPIEAISTLKMMTGDSMAEKMTNLIAALSSGQQQVKTAQTTPPPTGV